MLLLVSPRSLARLALLLVAFGLLLPRALAETAAESRAMAVRELVLDIMSYTRWPTEPAVLRMCVDASKPCTGGHYMGATAHAAAMEAHGAGEAAAHDMHDMAGMHDMHDMHEAESTPAASGSAQ